MQEIYLWIQMFDLHSTYVIAILYVGPDYVCLISFS